MDLLLVVSAILFLSVVALGVIRFALILAGVED